MGLGPAAIKLNLELWQRGFFKNIKSAIDMGAQEVHLPLVDFEQLVRAAGVSNYKKENFAILTDWKRLPRCSAKPFYEMLGVEHYSCIDLGGEHGAIPFDLNLPLEDASLYGKYDLVTDYGNNEHIFNIAEAYRTMHRLCKQQGLMIVMQGVFFVNGYYAYDLSFFEGIAAANNYKILFSSYWLRATGSINQFHVPLSRELLDMVDWAKMNHIGICYVMQKQSGSSDFHYPYQGQFLSEVQGHKGYQLQFLPDPPSRTYLPLRGPLHTLEEASAADILKQLVGRLLRKTRLYGLLQLWRRLAPRRLRF